MLRKWGGGPVAATSEGERTSKTGSPAITVSSHGRSSIKFYEYQRPYLQKVELNLPTGLLGGESLAPQRLRA